MSIRSRDAALVLGLITLVSAAACPHNTPITPLTTDVGSSVATMVITRGIVDVQNDCSQASPAAPDFRAWWAAMPPANRKYPFAGFQLWRNAFSTCTSSRNDAYRALVTFNMAGVSNLKGLVTRAELFVETRALPDSQGRLLSIGPLGTSSQRNADCPMGLGGGSLLQRIAPANVASLPAVSGTGELAEYPFFPTPVDPPVGTTIYTFPARLNAGPVPGATSPTTLSPTGQGGAVFVTDVTNTVNAALNGNFAGLSYMLTSNFEGAPMFPLLPGHNIDCRTSYDFRLRLTHL